MSSFTHKRASHMIAAILVVILGSATESLAAPAKDPPMTPDAHQHYVAGLEHYAHKRYDDAVSELATAYALDPRREILFAWAQAKRLKGDCPTAVTLYRRFLETSPSGQQAELAEGGIARCEESMPAASAAPKRRAPELPPRPPAKPTPTPAPTPVAQPAIPPRQPPLIVAAPAPSVDAAEARREAPPRVWYRDRLGDALAIGAVVTLSVGTGYFLASSSDVDAGSSARIYGEYAGRFDSARSERAVAWTALAAGTGLAAAAGLRFLQVARGSESFFAPLWAGGASAGVAFIGRY